MLANNSDLPSAEVFTHAEVIQQLKNFGLYAFYYDGARETVARLNGNTARRGWEQWLSRTDSQMLADLVGRNVLDFFNSPSVEGETVLFWFTQEARDLLTRSAGDVRAFDAAVRMGALGTVRGA